MHYILKQKVPNESVSPIQIHITESEVGFGRNNFAPLNQFTLISRHHATFFQTEDESLFVKDLNSLNGVYVNGTRIGSSLKRLSLGDTIGFGVSSEHIEGGFVCVLCSDVLLATVKQEVIEISDSEEQVKDTNLNRNSTDVPIKGPTSSSRSQVSNEISFETSTSNIITVPVSALSACQSTSRTIVEISHDETNGTNIVTAPYMPLPACQSLSTTVVESIPLKSCVVKLVKCDSKQFKWPLDVKNPFVKKCNGFTYKKHVRKLSSESSDEDSRKEISSDSSSTENQNASLCVINNDVNKKQLPWATKQAECVRKKKFTSSLVNLNQSTTLGFRNINSKSIDNQSDSAGNQATASKTKCESSMVKTLCNPFASAENHEKNVAQSKSVFKTSIFSSNSRREKGQINNHATSNSAKIGNKNHNFVNSAHSKCKAEPEVSKNNDIQNGNTQKKGEQIENRKIKHCFATCNIKTTEVPSSSNLKDKIVTGPALQDVNVSGDEIIVISDDESCDFKSSETSSHMEVEPGERANENCMQNLHTGNAVCHIMDHERENVVLPKIQKGNDLSSKEQPETLNINLDTLPGNNDFPNTRNHTYDAAENKKTKCCSGASNENLFDNQPHFSGGNLNDETTTSHEFQYDEVNYSQNEEIITISDDESYYDFKSSQTYVHIKTEPEDVDDNGEDICGQIFDNDEEFESLYGSKPDNFFHSTVETDDRVESIESIQAFISGIKSTDQKESESDSNSIPTNDFFPLLSQTFESDASDDLDENMSHCVDLPVSSGAVKSSLEINLNSRTNKIDETNTSTSDTSTVEQDNQQYWWSLLNPKPTTASSSTRRTVLIDPKPMKPKQQRGRQKKERTVGKKSASISQREKNKISHSNEGTKSSCSRLSEISLNLKVDTSSNHSKKPEVRHTSKLESLSSKAEASAKKSPIKMRSDKFASRMGFLTEEVNASPSETNKYHKRLIGVRKKRTAGQVSAETQGNSTCSKNHSLTQNNSINLASRNKSVTQDVPFVPLNKSVTQNTAFMSFQKSASHNNGYVPSSRSQNMPVPVVPLNKPISINLSIPYNNPVIQNVSVPSVHPDNHVSHAPVSVPQNNSLSLPKVCNSGTSGFNPRDPRLNRTNSSLSSPKCNKLNALPSQKMCVEMNSIASNDKAAGKFAPGYRKNDSVPENLSRRLVRNLLELNVAWLIEQTVMNSPPPLVSNRAADLPLSFNSYDLYVSAYYPMLMLEIWEQMFDESKEIFASKKNFKKFFFSVLSYTKKDDYVELRCESIVNEKVCFCPRDGNLTILELKESSTKLRSVFGYIFSHKIEPLNLTYIINSCWNKLDKDWLINAKHWIFLVHIKKRDFAFEINSLMRGNGLSYIRNKLRLASALNYLKNSPLLTDILQPRWNSFLVNYSSSYATNHRSSCQMEVIKGICDEINKPRQEPKIILLQGPPGTGKTHTIIGLIEELLCSHNYDSNFKILIAAPSNAAVDEIGCRLIELNQKCNGKDQVELVRFGIEEQVNREMKPYFIDRKAKKEFEREKRQNQSLQTFQDYTFKMKVLTKCHIVLSTLSSCGVSLLLKTFNKNSALQFSCCIIDESTQCTELDILQPLVLGLSKLVLVGDHEQLPATVRSKLACSHGFEKSMFERFHLYFTRCYKKTPTYTLNEQFRMHSAICEFPSKHFYNGRLFTNPRTNLLYQNFPLHPYILLDILISQESSDSSSVVNNDEAKVIVNICSYLLDIKHSPSSIGIITPYQAQRLLYRNALCGNPWYSQIEVNTVDGFQGREKDIIILSSVRANSQSGSIGFLASKQRLNVAITRAKKCLIICVHVNSLEQNPDWRALIQDAKDRNVCVGVTDPKDIPFLFKTHMKKTVQYY